MLGPDYQEPYTSWDAGWNSQSLKNIQNIKAGTAPSQEWWDMFDDPALNDLIAAGLKDNRNLKIAGLRVIESRTLLAGAKANLAPQQIQAIASGGYGANAVNDAKISDSDFTFTDTELSIGWELDFWGRFARAIEANNALYLQSIADYEDFKILLTSEIARQYFTYRTLQQRIDILDQNAKLQKRSLEITTNRYKAGEDSELNVQQAKAQYLATISSRPSLEDNLERSENALTALIGLPPQDIKILRASKTNFEKIPDTIVHDIPADLLRRRPDIRAASFRAAAASASIGIAEAELYPSLSLFGTIGISDTSRGGITDVLSLAAGPSVRWNIFDFGRIRNNIRVQDARFEQALEAYQETVIQAAHEVDDAAISFVKTRDEIALLERSETVSKRAYDIALIHFQEGFSDFQRLLDAQASLLRQQDRLIAAKGQEAIILTQIYKAIAGSWVTSDEDDYINADTKERMSDRTNWGNLLEFKNTPNDTHGIKTEKVNHHDQ